MTDHAPHTAGPPDRITAAGIAATQAAVADEARREANDAAAKRAERAAARTNRRAG